MKRCRRHGFSRRHLLLKKLFKEVGEARVLSVNGENQVQWFPICVEAFDVALRFVITYEAEPFHIRFAAPLCQPRCGSSTPQAVGNLPIRRHITEEMDDVKPLTPLAATPAFIGKSSKQRSLEV